MDDINYKNLMLRIEKFYNYENDGSEHDFRIECAEELINGQIEKRLFQQLGNPRNVYELMIQLELRGY